jgi:hypothetical protein
MITVSTKEFNTHQEKYFDLAVKENVCIRRGQQIFRLSCTSVAPQYPEQPVCDDNSDLETVITGDELRERLHRRIHVKFATRV